MNKHYAELTQKFQQLMDIRNELKELLDTAETTSLEENKPTCFLEVDRWEQRTIERIREVSRKVRTNINAVMTKNVTEVRDQLEQLSARMQQLEKEENYLETDMKEVELQLQQLIATIQHIKKKGQVITSDKIEWDTLIHVKINEISTQVSLENEASVNRKPKSVRESTSSHQSDRQPILRTRAFQPFQSDDSRFFQPITAYQLTPKLFLRTRSINNTPFERERKTGYDDVVFAVTYFQVPSIIFKIYILLQTASERTKERYIRKERRIMAIYIRNIFRKLLLRPWKYVSVKTTSSYSVFPASSSDAFFIDRARKTILRSVDIPSNYLINLS